MPDFPLYADLVGHDFSDVDGLGQSHREWMDAIGQRMNNGMGGWIYGDGSDGPHVCTDGETMDSGHFTDYTIPDGVTVFQPLGGVVICCTGTFTINGTISGIGPSAIDRNPVVGVDGGGGQAGGGASGQREPLGGTGGDGSAGVGGAGGSSPLRMFLRSVFAITNGNGYLAGPGGGGGGDGTNYGGAGGGGGAANLLVFARHIAHGPDNLYDYHGGDGAPGGDDGTGATGNGDCGGGGGGGGAGGWWQTISDTLTGVANANLAGGLGGAGCGTGTDGQPGQEGYQSHILNR
jgi:hypothetical protein